MIVTFRRHTLPPLCSAAIDPASDTISAASICLQRDGISRMPDVEGDKPKRQQFKQYTIGFIHIDIAEVQTVERKLYLFLGIDRTSKFAVTQLVERRIARPRGNSSNICSKPSPIASTPSSPITASSSRSSPAIGHSIFKADAFGMICEANGIEHRLTKPNHPWTNRQVELMNRTIKEPIAKRFHYENYNQLRTHFTDFTAAYNFARTLKTLNGLTPYGYISKI